MNRLTRTHAFWIIVGLQVMLLVGMTGLQEYRLANGTVVRLAVTPVDPVDLARGSYVELQYAIGANVKADLDASFESPDEVYVALRRGPGGIHEASRAYDELGDVPDGSLYLRGQLEGSGRSTLQVSFPGIQTLYLSPEKAHEAERLLDGTKPAIVSVSLREDGTGSLCGLERLDDVEARCGS